MPGTILSCCTCGEHKCLVVAGGSSGSDEYNFCDNDDVGLDSTCPCEYKVNVCIPEWTSIDNCTKPDSSTVCYTRTTVHAIDISITVSATISPADICCPCSARECNYWGTSLSVGTLLHQTATTGGNCVPSAGVTDTTDISAFIVANSDTLTAGFGDQPKYEGSNLVSHVCGDDIDGTNEATCSGYYVGICYGKTFFGGDLFSGGIVYRKNRGGLDCDDLGACFDQGYSESYRVSPFYLSGYTAPPCCDGDPLWRNWGLSARQYAKYRCTDLTDYSITVSRV